MAKDSNKDLDDECLMDMSGKVIQCLICCRTFSTQAQFGQHSRICSGGTKIQKKKFINIKDQPYKYCFMENQVKNKLEIKCRFKITILNNKITWKSISKEHSLHDNGVLKLLKDHNLDSVHVSIRHRKESGLIVANFVVREVKQNLQNVHNAKLNIQKAAKVLKDILPTDKCKMEVHVCKINDCREIVIRDTEGFCSRHRAQKYHRKTVQKKLYKKKISNLQMNNSIKIPHLTQTNNTVKITDINGNSNSNSNNNRMTNSSNMNIDNSNENFKTEYHPNIPKVSLQMPNLTPNGIQISHIRFDTETPKIQTGNNVIRCNSVNNSLHVPIHNHYYNQINNNNHNNNHSNNNTHMNSINGNTLLV